MQQRGDRGHRGHLVIHAVKNRVHVRLQFRVCLCLGELSKIRDGLCHEGY